MILAVANVKIFSPNPYDQFLRRNTEKDGIMTANYDNQSIVGRFCEIARVSPSRFAASRQRQSAGVPAWNLASQTGLTNRLILETIGVIPQRLTCRTGYDGKWRKTLIWRKVFDVIKGSLYYGAVGCP